MSGEVTKKVKAMCTNIYCMGRERFWVVEARAKTTPFGGCNRQEKEIKQIRADFRKLKKAYRKSLPEERDALEERRRVLRRN